MYDLLSLQKSPIFPWKSPMSPQKSSLSPQKSPTSSQKSPISAQIHIAHMDESRHTCGWVKSHNSPHIYGWFKSYIWMSHVTHEWVISHVWIRYIWMSHLKHMNKYIWISHHHTYE